MTTASVPLPLATRNGLPAEIAYLRATYPAPDWRTHRNFGELSAFWLQVHASLRDHGARLQQTTLAFREGRLDAAGFQRVFVPHLNQFLQHLNAHHQIEDTAYFPKFRALDRRMKIGFDLLENDHHVIHDALLASADRARALLAAMARDDDDRRRAADHYANGADTLLALLLRHLADEEDLVIPAMLDHGERSVT